MIPQPPTGDPKWQGQDPTTHTVERNVCATTSPSTGFIEYRVVENATEPPVDPAILAIQAGSTLPIPDPQLEIGPNADQVAVNLPIWLSVQNPGALTASATAGTVTATVTAQISATTYSIGDGGSVTCTGAGSQPNAGSDLSNPPCRYTFQLRSLPERTDGKATWSITATTTWTVTWTSNIGAQGQFVITRTAAIEQYVGEFRTVIVPGN